MTRDDFAAFLERLGHRVTRSESCYWYDAGPRFYMAMPHTIPVAPAGDELRRLFGAARCLGARFVAPPDGEGRVSYALTVQDRGYELDRLSPNTRSKVRRGLRQCDVRRVDAQFVRAHGRTANTDTIRRLRFMRDQYDWDRYWDAVAATPAIEVWGALQDSRLLAYLVIALVENCAEILIARSRDDGLRAYPNNALLFAAVRDLVRRPDVDRVLFGLESLETVDSVNQFKESMGFVRSPIHQRVVLHPAIERFVGVPLVGRLTRSIARRRTQSEFWRKLEGLLVLHGTLEDTRVREAGPCTA